MVAAVDLNFMADLCLGPCKVRFIFFAVVVEEEIEVDDLT
jgi:hypothetical protein